MSDQQREKNHDKENDMEQLLPFIDQLITAALVGLAHAGALIASVGLLVLVLGWRR